MMLPSIMVYNLLAGTVMKGIVEFEVAKLSTYVE